MLCTTYAHQFKIFFCSDIQVFLIVKVAETFGDLRKYGTSSFLANEKSRKSFKGWSYCVTDNVKAICWPFQTTPKRCLQLRIMEVRSFQPGRYYDMTFEFTDLQSLKKYQPLFMALCFKPQGSSLKPFINMTVLLAYA